MTEAKLLLAVVQVLGHYGWRWCHFRPARTKKGWRTAVQGDVGFPDLIAARNGRLLIIELKSARGKLSPEQKEWIDALSPDELRAGPLNGAEVYIWRPKHWMDGTIERALKE